MTLRNKLTRASRVILIARDVHEPLVQLKEKLVILIQNQRPCLDQLTGVIVVHAEAVTTSVQDDRSVPKLEITTSNRHVCEMVELMGRKRR